MVPGGRDHRSARALHARGPVRECERAALQPEPGRLGDRQARQAAAHPDPDVPLATAERGAREPAAHADVRRRHVQTVFETLEATGETSNTLAFFLVGQRLRVGGARPTAGRDGLRGVCAGADVCALARSFHARCDRQPHGREPRPRADDRGRRGRDRPRGPDGRPLPARPASEPHAHPDRVRGRCRRTSSRGGRLCVRSPRTTSSTTTAPTPRRSCIREYYDLFADPFELDNLLGDASAANDPNTAAPLRAAGGRPRVRRGHLPVAVRGAVGGRQSATPGHSVPTANC